MWHENLSYRLSRIMDVELGPNSSDDGKACRLDNTQGGSSSTH